MLDIKGQLVVPGDVVQLIRIPFTAVTVFENVISRYIVLSTEEEDGTAILFPYQDALALEKLPDLNETAVRYSTSMKQILIEKVSDYSIDVVYNFFRHLGNRYLKLLNNDSSVCTKLVELHLDELDRQYYVSQYLHYMKLADLTLYGWKLKHKLVSCEYQIGDFVQVTSEHGVSYHLIISDEPTVVCPFELTACGLNSDSRNCNIVPLNLSECNVQVVPEKSSCITFSTQVARRSVFRKLLRDLEYLQNSLCSIGEFNPSVRDIADKYRSIWSKLVEESK